MRYKSIDNTLKLNTDKCVGCGLCAIVCPHRVFQLHEKKATIIHQSRCMECGACKSNCPVAAIDVDSGVGCAIAIINGIRNKSGPCC